MPSRSALNAPAWMAFVFVLGVAARIAPLGYATSDATDFLLPWYRFAAEHGLASLGTGFTNYTPAYSYLLLLATLADGLAPPLALVKCISFPFELGCAIAGGRLARLASDRPGAAPAAFAAIWLAPSVLHNGAFWGQCDAIWTFLLLVSVLAFLRDRPAAGMIAFGGALAVKAQAAFLGHFVLGLLLRGGVRPATLLLLPLPYLVLALPAVLAGRPPAELAAIYLGQSATFRSLSMNAANLYVFLPASLYPAWPLGLAAAALSGLALARAMMRPARLDRFPALLAAALSLLLMPFLLPKMHERFFYGFEVLALVLACSRPGYWPAAILAQLGSLLSYLPFDGLPGTGLPLAALGNLLIVLHLGARWREEIWGPPGTESAWRILASGRPVILFALVEGSLALALLGGQLLGRALDRVALWPEDPSDPIGLAMFLGALALALLVARRLESRGANSRQARTAVPEARSAWNGDHGQLDRRVAGRGAAR